MESERNERTARPRRACNSLREPNHRLETGRGSDSYDLIGVNVMNVLPVSARLRQRSFAPALVRACDRSRQRSFAPALVERLRSPDEIVVMTPGRSLGVLTLPGRCRDATGALPGFICATLGHSQPARRNMRRTAARATLLAGPRSGKCMWAHYCQGAYFL